MDFVDLSEDETIEVSIVDLSESNSDILTELNKLVEDAPIEKTSYDVAEKDLDLVDSLSRFIGSDLHTADEPLITRTLKPVKTNVIPEYSNKSWRQSRPITDNQESDPLDDDICSSYVISIYDYSYSLYEEDSSDLCLHLPHTDSSSDSTSESSSDDFLRDCMSRLPSVLPLNDIYGVHRDLNELSDLLRGREPNRKWFGYSHYEMHNERNILKDVNLLTMAINGSDENGGQTKKRRKDATGAAVDEALLDIQLTEDKVLSLPRSFPLGDLLDIEPSVCDALKRNRVIVYDSELNDLWKQREREYDRWGGDNFGIIDFETCKPVKYHHHIFLCSLIKEQFIIFDLLFKLSEHSNVCHLNATDNHPELCHDKCQDRTPTAASADDFISWGKDYLKVSFCHGREHTCLNNRHCFRIFLKDEAAVHSTMVADCSKGDYITSWEFVKEMISPIKVVTTSKSRQFVVKRLPRSLKELTDRQDLEKLSGLAEGCFYRGPSVSSPALEFDTLHNEARMVNYDPNARDERYEGVIVHDWRTEELIVPPSDNDFGEHYQVDFMHKFRIHKGELQAQVQWQGWHPQWQTWAAFQSFTHIFGEANRQAHTWNFVISHFQRCLKSIFLGQGSIRLSQQPWDLETKATAGTVVTHESKHKSTLLMRLKIPRSVKVEHYIIPGFWRGDRVGNSTDCKLTALPLNHELLHMSYDMAIQNPLRVIRRDDDVVEFHYVKWRHVCPYLTKKLLSIDEEEENRTILFQSLEQLDLDIKSCTESIRTLRCLHAEALIEHAMIPLAFDDHMGFKINPVEASTPETTFTDILSHRIPFYKKQQHKEVDCEGLEEDARPIRDSPPKPALRSMFGALEMSDKGSLVPRLFVLPRQGCMKKIESQFDVVPFSNVHLYVADCPSCHLHHVIESDGAFGYRFMHLFPFMTSKPHKRQRFSVYFHHLLAKLKHEIVVVSKVHKPPPQVFMPTYLSNYRLEEVILNRIIPIKVLDRKLIDDPGGIIRLPALLLPSRTPHWRLWLALGNDTFSCIEDVPKFIDDYCPVSKSVLCFPYQNFRLKDNPRGGSVYHVARSSSPIYLSLKFAEDNVGHLLQEFKAHYMVKFIKDSLPISTFLILPHLIASKLSHSGPDGRCLLTQELSPVELLRRSIHTKPKYSDTVPLLFPGGNRRSELNDVRIIVHHVNPELEKWIENTKVLPHHPKKVKVYTRQRVLYETKDVREGYCLMEMHGPSSAVSLLLEEVAHLVEESVADSYDDLRSIHFVYLLSHQMCRLAGLNPEDIDAHLPHHATRVVFSKHGVPGCTCPPGKRGTLLENGEGCCATCTENIKFAISNDIIQVQNDNEYLKSLYHWPPSHSPDPSCVSTDATVIVQEYALCFTEFEPLSFHHSVSIRKQMKEVIAINENLIDLSYRHLFDVEEFRKYFESILKRLVSDPFTKFDTDQVPKHLVPFLLIFLDEKLAEMKDDFLDKMNKRICGKDISLLNQLGESSAMPSVDIDEFEIDSDEMNDDPTTKCQENHSNDVYHCKRVLMASGDDDNDVLKIVKKKTDSDRQKLDIKPFAERQPVTNLHVIEALRLSTLSEAITSFYDSDVKLRNVWKDVFDVTESDSPPRDGVTDVVSIWACFSKWFYRLDREGLISKRYGRPCMDDLQPTAISIPCNQQMLELITQAVFISGSFAPVGEPLEDKISLRDITSGFGLTSNNLIGSPDEGFDGRGAGQHGHSHFLDPDPLKINNEIVPIRTTIHERVHEQIIRAIPEFIDEDTIPMKRTSGYTTKTTKAEDVKCPHYIYQVVDEKLTKLTDYLCHTNYPGHDFYLRGMLPSALLEPERLELSGFTRKDFSNIEWEDDIDSSSSDSG
eukprot:GHVH01000438.1.p1 GENE.GHVH01000438.1~~GHVH01000438.1.p1  ORF type:complete len:1857 (+),score=266.07 GHVH01000438.1:26-5572(+)